MYTKIIGEVGLMKEIWVSHCISCLKEIPKDTELIAIGRRSLCCNCAIKVATLVLVCSNG